MVVLDCFFSFGRQNAVAARVRQVVVVHSNNCMEICLGGLKLVVLDKQSSYRGGDLNKFDRSLFLTSLGSEMSLNMVLFFSKCWRKLSMSVCDT